MCRVEQNSLKMPSVAAQTCGLPYGEENIASIPILTFPRLTIGCWLLQIC